MPDYTPKSRFCTGASIDGRRGAKVIAEDEQQEDQGQPRHRGRDVEGRERVFPAVADLFTDVLQRGAAVPEQWRLSTIKVMFKKSDPKLVCNHRPISILPILYKGFAKVLLEQLKPTLEASQCRDQAGFRAGFSCEDHLQSIVNTCEKARE